MTEKKRKSRKTDVKALLAGDEEFLRALVRTALQGVLEADMTEALGAERGADGKLDGVPVGLLLPHPDHANWQTRASGWHGHRRLS